MSVKAAAALACLFLAAGLAACNKGPAREALAEVDRQLATAQPLLETYAPERLPPLRGLRSDAAARLAASEYTQALRLAQGLPGQIEGALAVAKARRDALGAEWTPVAGRVPLVLEGAERRASELAAEARPSKGLDAEALGEVQAELQAVRAAWAQANAQFESGQLPKAVASGREVQARVEAAASRLGLSPAAAMAVAAAPPPSPAGSPLASPVPAAAPR
ncbi:MAG TPA: hypothetical protein VEQ10_07505 [Vicinamibacteria bacterium]|nr:hypothetical protein [Vicinamibacteria bacterium]